MCEYFPEYGYPKTRVYPQHTIILMIGAPPCSETSDFVYDTPADGAAAGTEVTIVRALGAEDDVAAWPSQLKTALLKL